jgi:hypothetical protein
MNLIALILSPLPRHTECILVVKLKCQVKILVHRTRRKDTTAGLDLAAEFGQNTAHRYRSVLVPWEEVVP